MEDDSLQDLVRTQAEAITPVSRRRARRRLIWTLIAAAASGVAAYFGR